jgi:hypothetical protein
MKTLTILFILFHFSYFSQIKIEKKISSTLRVISKNGVYYLSNQNNKTLSVLSLNSNDKIVSVFSEKNSKFPGHLKITYIIENQENNKDYMSRLKIRRFLIINTKTNNITFHSTEMIDFEKMDPKTKREFNFFHTLNYQHINKSEIEVFSVDKKGDVKNIQKNYVKDFEIYFEKGEGVYQYMKKNIEKK